jgi:hypothetical protein
MTPFSMFQIVEWSPIRAQRIIVAGLIGGVLVGVWHAPEYCSVVRLGGFCQQPGRDLDHDHHDQQSPNRQFVRSGVISSTVSGTGSITR